MKKQARTFPLGKALKGLGFACAAIVAATALFALSPKVDASIFDTSSTSSSPQEPSTFASLSGFQPGAKVGYMITGEDGTYESGSATIDEFGNLALPLPDLHPDGGKDLIYNFVIDEEKGALNIILTRDPETGLVAVEGQGAPEFTNIVIESDEETRETRSDWAGIFKETDINHAFLPENNAENIKIAFFNADPTRGIEEITRSPSIIQVQMRTGGGGPDSTNVNQFETNYCGHTGDGTPISFCNTQRTTAHIQSIVNNLITPLQIMAEQLHFNAIQQVFVIGTFFDGKEQLDAQRQMQKMMAETHRDYQPSEQMCRFGSYIRDVAHTEEKVRHNILAFNQIMMDTYLNTEGTSAAPLGEIHALRSRLEQFRTTYCDPSDHNGKLGYLCEHDQDGNLSNSNPGAATNGLGAPNTQRMNKDIDYARTVDSHYTLDLDFVDGVENVVEEDVIALAKNLYWPTAFDHARPREILSRASDFFDARHFLALQNVAHNSYAHQLAMKAKAIPPDTTTTTTPPASGGGIRNTGILTGLGYTTTTPTSTNTTTLANGAPTPGWAYIKTMMRDFGLSDQDIEAMIGREPSYYAQMDFLTKKLYQSPNFYTNLYDKPVNIDRISVFLDAVSLMQQRDHYEALLRQEMVNSALVQTDLIPHMELIQTALDPNN